MFADRVNSIGLWPSIILSQSLLLHSFLITLIALFHGFHLHHKISQQFWIGLDTKNRLYVPYSAFTSILSCIEAHLPFHADQ